MTVPGFPSKIGYSNGQPEYQNYKAYINYWNNQASLHGDKPFARYYKDNGYNTLTYSEVDRLAINLACKWASKTQGANVISYIGDHSVVYLIIFLAILKLRATLMTVSPRNSEAAFVNLLENTQSKTIIADAKYKSIALSSAAQVSGVAVIIHDPFDIEALLQEPLNSNHTDILDYNFSDKDINKVALIIHSSGSTAFPKPIPTTNLYVFHVTITLQLLARENGNNLEIDHNDVCLSSVPLFHLFGVFVTLNMISVGGTVVFLEKLPASPEEIDAALTNNKCTLFGTPPLTLEQLIPYMKEKNDVSALQKLKFIIYGGASLKHEVAEWYHSNGINACNSYGTSEIGPMMSADVSPGSRNRFSLRPYLKDPNGSFYIQFETVDENEPDIKHAYVRNDSPMFALGIANRPDGGYNTNDIFRENPNYPGFYDHVGRIDDTLVMENGEKTNPIPMEATIRQSNIVNQVAVIGHGRQCTAALVEVNMDYAIKLRPKDIILSVQEAVEEANKDCPSHSVILPEMIEILPLNKTLPSTDKGTVVRKRAEATYQDEVEQLYKDMLEGPSRKKVKHNDGSSTCSSITMVESFLTNAAAEVLRIPVSDLEDSTRSLFDYGLNSLLAIQLRNRILERFDDVPQSFIFQNPSIPSMCKTLIKGFNRSVINEQTESQYKETENLALTYISRAKNDFPIAQNIYREEEEEEEKKVVMLTGVTGSLGSFMLRDLLMDRKVKKVYAIVRGKQEHLMKRVFDAFHSRYLDTSLLETDRLEVLPMCFNDSFLGFGKEKYHQLKKEVTIVQHCAWLLDFNMPVAHYDKECIAPFYNLLKFAYKQVDPMHVHFVSSVSASAGSGSSIVEEPLPLDSHSCMNMGYAHSKFVVEVLFNYLTTEKNFPCYVERLGQVCGDSSNGVWNISEQYPLMFIGGGSIMHKIPNLDTHIDWITADYAAASIKDIMLRTSNLSANQDQSIYHIVNPNMIHWKDVLQSMKNSGMKFDIVSPSKWVQELSKDDTNPAYKLMNFYEAQFKGAFNMPTWETKKTSIVAPHISKSPTLNTDLFSKFLNHWESIGFYNPSI